MTASNPEFVKKSEFTCCKNRRGPYMGKAQRAHHDVTMHPIGGHVAMLLCAILQGRVLFLYFDALALSVSATS